MAYTYCPKCGHILESQFIDDRDRGVCPNCGFIHYQHSKLCVGVLVVDEEKLLLVKRAIEPFKGWWDIPGGFLEVGEHPEDGAVRELEEETTLIVRPTDIIGLYMANYGPSGDAVLTICYKGEVVSGVASPASDASEVHWFPFDALPAQVAFEWSMEAIEKLKAQLPK